MANPGLRLARGQASIPGPLRLERGHGAHVGRRRASCPAHGPRPTRTHTRRGRPEEMRAREAAAPGECRPGSLGPRRQQDQVKKRLETHSATCWTQSRLGHQQADATLHPLPAGLLLVPRQRKAEPAPQAAVPRAPSAAMARALPAPHTRLHPQGHDTPRDTSGRREKAPV